MRPHTRAQSVLLLTLAMTLAAWPLYATLYYIELGTTALIAAMFALSLQLLVGCTGLVSLGHSGFLGMAAYSVYLMTPSDRGLSLALTLPLSILAAGALAALIGSLALRTRGFFFLMVTLAFGQMIFFFFHDTKLGGGTDGAFLARPIFGLMDYQLELTRRQRPIAVYLLSLGLLCGMFLALHTLMKSRFGRVLAGIKVNESRMQALGYDTYRFKLGAFTIAGLLAGVAGHTWIMHRGFVNPELASWHRSAEALLMILIGGLGTLHGPILGALAYVGLQEVSQLITERKLLFEGSIILLFVLALPNGLTGIALPTSLLKMVRSIVSTGRTSPQSAQGGRP